MFQMTVWMCSPLATRVVATGPVAVGSLRVGDKVLVNSRIQAKVKSIEVFRRMIQEATVGDNIGIMFARRDLEVVAGDVLTSADDGAWL